MSKNARAALLACIIVAIEAGAVVLRVAGRVCVIALGVVVGLAAFYVLFDPGCLC